MPDFLKSYYVANITQVIEYCGTIYKHFPDQDWFILGNKG